MDLSKDSQDPDELIGCVGYCRVFVVDSDGLQRKTKGSRLEAPVHVRRDESSGARIVSAYFPANDPVFMLKLQNDSQEFVYAKIWAGSICKPDENPNTNRLLCVLEGQCCKTLLDEVEASSNSTSRCSAFLPLIPDCYASPVQASITVTSLKFAFKVVKIEVEIPDNIYEKWLQYVRILRKLEKDEAADKAGKEKK